MSILYRCIECHTRYEGAPPQPWCPECGEKLVMTAAQMPGKDYRMAQAIRTRSKSGERMTTLAHDYGLPAETISAIVRCRTIEGATVVIKAYRMEQA
jgi:DNA-directed RNA polymerase subunit RPC12/RpoP